MPILSPADARLLFTGARAAHLATADTTGRPHLVPVTFAVVGDVVVTAVDHKPKRSTRLKRLANIRANSAACLLVDHYEENWDRLWWVRADGHGRVLTPAAHPAETARYAAHLAEKYPIQYGDHPPTGEVVRIVITRWSGWKASPAVPRHCDRTS